MSRFGRLVAAGVVVLAVAACAAAVETDNAPAGAGAGEGRAFTTADASLALASLLTAALLLRLWASRQRRLEPVRELFCPWGGEDVLWGIALFIVLLWVVGSAARQLLPGEDHPWRAAAVMGLCGLAAAFFLLRHLRRRYGLLPRDLGLHLERGRRDLLLAVGLLAGVLAVRYPLGGFLEYLRQRAGEPEHVQEVLVQMRDARSPFALGVLVVVALAAAPLWEEILFRGFLQPFLTRRVGAGASIVSTALLFSLIHYSGSRFLIVPALVFPLALALGYAYHRTQRLAAPLMLHVLHNLVTVVAVLTMGKE